MITVEWARHEASFTGGSSLEWDTEAGGTCSDFVARTKLRLARCLFLRVTKAHGAAKGMSQMHWRKRASVLPRTNDFF